ncbi:hypothetical protein SE11_22665, partial [Salmonella enterica subsp. enterica serovar Braenderup]
VLAREIPMILRTEIYATACIIGGFVYATPVFSFFVTLGRASKMGLVGTLFICLAATCWQFKMPTFVLGEKGR